MQHSLPEQILVLKNRTLRKLRAHTAHSPRSMTSLAIELIDTGSSGNHTSDRTISYRLLRQRLCLLQRAVKWREAVGRARVVPRRQVPDEQAGFIGRDLCSPLLHFLDCRLPAPAR